MDILKIHQAVKNIVEVVLLKKIYDVDEVKDVEYALVVPVLKHYA